MQPSKLESYQQSIRAAYPAFPIHSVQFNEQGQNNDVLVINDTHIFRFPKYPQAREQLEIETLILDAIQQKISLAIPAPTHIHLEAEVGQAFTGYPIIAGEPLWRDTFRAIQDERVVEKLAAQLAGFLHQLHHIPVKETIPCKLSLIDTREESLDIYTRMREKLFSFMRPDAREWTVNHFESFLDDPRNFEYEPVLKHGDFGPSNILYDSEAQSITGIIDFGGSGLGDPAYDFAGLLSGYGEPFILECARTYPEVASFLHRIKFYQGTFALYEALFGIENDDHEAFEAGIAQYV